MTIEQIKEANARAGHHFFEPGTMRFFRSRLSERTHGRFFVTSEKGPNGVRAYTVRMCNDNGRIATVGDFQGYTTMSAAQWSARWHHEQEESWYASVAS